MPGTFAIDALLAASTLRKLAANPARAARRR
jgi:hypothetical protein